MRGSAGRAATDLDVQHACLAAQEAVTEPNTGSGLYERVDAWLKAAGAPYATGEAAADDPRTFVSGELGLLSSIGSDTSSWGSSYAYLFPKDLLDFNHEATVNGEHFVPCASPLTSKNPCGPVGPYNAQFEAGIDYGGINGHWKGGDRGDPGALA